MDKSKKVSRERFLREQFGTAGKRISFRHEWNIGDPRRHELRDHSWLRTGLQCPSPKAGLEATGEGHDWLLTGLQCPIRKEGE